jgi:hypothetical protein
VPALWRGRAHALGGAAEMKALAIVLVTAVVVSLGVLAAALVKLAG